MQATGFHLAGGGTGGHLFPALAIAEALQERFQDCEISFWGTTRGVESQILPQKGYRWYRIWVQGFLRRWDLKNLLFPFTLLASFIKIVVVLLWHRPQAVIGTGGYVSGPVILAAFLLRIPCFIQEQNVFPGATSRILSRIAKRIYLNFEASRSYFRNQAKILVTGNPVRLELRRVNRRTALQKWNLSPQLKTLFVFGGSQGAHSLNKVMLEIAASLVNKLPLQIIWSTGKLDYMKVLKNTALHRQKIKVFEFIDDMGAAYAVSDLALCRAGATTVAELSFCEVPPILVPYPHATAGHQEFNARALEKANAAVCILENELSAKRLFDLVEALVTNEEKLQQMRTNLRLFAHPDAAKTIVEDIVRTLRRIE